MGKDNQAILPYNIEFWVVDMKVRGYSDRYILDHSPFNKDIISRILERYRYGMYSEFAKKVEALIDKRKLKRALEWIALGKPKQEQIIKYDPRALNYLRLMCECLARFGIVSPALISRTIEVEELESGPGSYLLKHPECYLNEARAMIEGKNWKGKNRCVKLPRDD